MLFFFTPAYEALLARRLLTGNYSSLLVEKSVLEALPALPRSHKMLFDVTQTTHIAEFGKYLMSKIDSDELPYTPALNIVLQKRHFNVHILCQHTWHKHAYQPMFAKLTLPAPMRAIQAQFNAYYKSTQDITHSGAGTRRVTWCHGSGIVTLTCHQRGGYKVDIVVNEPQAAVLYAFNTGQRCKTLATLCAATNLSLEEIRSVIESLSSDSFQSPLLTVDTTANEDAGDLTPMSRIRLSNALVQGDIGGSSCSGGSEDEQLDYAVHSAAHLRLEDINTCKDWRNELIDAVIVRVLKQTARRAAFSSDYENSVVQNKSVLTAAELLETVPTELGKRGKGSQAMLTSQEIFARADHLASVGFIDKVDLLTTTEGAERLPRDELVEVSAVSVGYCYIAHSTTGSISDESIHCVDGNASLSEKSSIPTGRALFDQLLSMAALAKIPPDDSSVSATESLQGAGRAGAGVGTGAGGGGEGGVAERNREEADERSGDDNGGDCDESKDEAAQVVAPTVTLEHPFLAIRSAEPSSSHFTEESGIDFEFFAQSLIHWVASISPPTEVSTPHTAHWERLSEVKPFDDSNISDMKSQSPFLSPLRPESAGKYGGIESKSRDSPAAASTTVRWYPRVQNPSTPTAAVTASPLRGTPSRQHPALFAALTPTTPRTFPPLPHTTVRSPYATFSAQANAELKAIHERSYGALGALMSQVNALLYQHSLGRLPVSGQELNCAFPPPSIDAYLDEVSKAFVLDCPSLSDWSALHRDFFCALPAELIAAVKAKFRALIGRESATHFDGQDRLSDLWNTKFSVCSGPKSATSAKTTSGTLDNAESATEEDSKQSAAEEDEDVHASCELDHDPLEQPSHFKVQISLCEFVLSTFSEATSAAVAAFSRGGSAGHLFESEESAPLFQTSKSASLQAGTSTPNSFHRGEQSSPHGMVGSVSQKQEKRRPRNRGRPPSAFSHSNRTTPPVRRPSNEDRSPQSGSSPNLLRGRDLISANRTAREKSFGELSASLARLREAEGKLGLEECRESDLPAREHFPHHQSYSYGDYFLGSQAATHNNSSRESSRRSSRSDSNGDFAVAQLMHSIEEQLRTPAPPSFTAFPPFPPLPALNGDMAKPAAVDTANSKEAGGERRLSSSKLHPHPTIEENIYKPEHKKEEFSSSLLGAGFVGKPVTPLTIFSRPTAARESLHDLVTRYFQHLHAHLCGVFQVEKQADADADAVLGRSVCQQIIRHLLQNAAQRVAELAASSESSSCTALDSSHQDQMLWFLSCSEEAGGRSREIGGGDEVISIGLDRILRAAFHMMDVNQDCILTAEDFPNIKVAQCLAEADHSTTACDFDFNFCSEQERTDVVFGRDSLVVTVAEKASAMVRLHY